jgi:hypothetical protein
MSSSKNNQTVELQPKKSLVEVKDTNKIILIFSLLSLALLFMATSSIGLAFLSWRLATKEKIYVSQKGKMEIAHEQDPGYRDNKLIQETVVNWMYLTWEWNSKIPNSSRIDQGIKVQTSNGFAKVPLRSYIGSYLIVPGFRQKFLADFSTTVPKSFYLGESNSTLIIHDISNARRINDRLYSVKVVASRIDLESGYEKQQTYINRTFYLQPIMPYRLVAPDAFRQQLTKLLKNGLMITEITP